MAADMNATSLPYDEPSMVTVLILSSFLLLLNALSSVFDHLLYCGLIAQILVGTAYGTPGWKLLSTPAQDTIQQLGYLGLVMLVYHGGLSTSVPALVSNLRLSAAVALTGIAVPMALSFALVGFAGVSYLQAFAAGAALCSTSLGTTFSVLQTSGLAGTRMGTVLASAAMIDDVVGLVMIKVVTALGPAVGSGFTAVTVIRPTLVSVAFAVVLAIGCPLVVAPISTIFNGWSVSYAKLNKVGSRQDVHLVAQTLFLVALCTGAFYAGTSVLYAAYLAGIVISWWDSSSTSSAELQNTPVSNVACTSARTIISSNEQTATSTNVRLGRTSSNDSSTRPLSKTSAMCVYEQFYHPAVHRIFKPLFFASIGFSLPIVQLFTGPVIWRGLVYSLLMSLGKLVCGLWLVRFDTQSISWSIFSTTSYRSKGQASSKIVQASSEPAQDEQRTTSSDDGTTPPVAVAPQANISRKVRKTKPPKPLSLYPAGVLGCAMVARGEIGFLISALAESSGVFGGAMASSTGGSSDLFLVVTWAVLLCTIGGPIVTGMLVKHIKKLQMQAATRGSGRKDPLGIWGVI